MRQDAALYGRPEARRYVCGTPTAGAFALEIEIGRREPVRQDAALYGRPEARRYPLLVGPCFSAPDELRIRGTGI